MANETAVPTAVKLRISDVHNGIIVESQTGLPRYEVLNPFSFSQSREHDEFVDITMESDARILAALLNTAFSVGGIEHAIQILILNQAANPSRDADDTPPAPVLHAYSVDGHPIVGEVHVMQLQIGCKVTRVDGAVTVDCDGTHEDWEENIFPDRTEDGQRKFTDAAGNIVYEGGIIWSRHEWKVLNPATGTYTVWMDGVYKDHEAAEDAAYEIIANHIKAELADHEAGGAQ
jgi:hypothetical protein